MNQKLLKFWLGAVCVIAAQVAQATPLTLTFEDPIGDGMSVDLICTGDMNGTGRLEYVFDSATHYTGSMNFTGTREGQQANMTNTMEGNWVSADCGNVEP